MDADYEGIHGTLPMEASGIPLIPQPICHVRAWTGIYLLVCIPLEPEECQTQRAHEHVPNECSVSRFDGTALLVARLEGGSYNFV